MNEDKCKKCMSDAPYYWCCKRECGQHEFCKDCTAKSKGNRMTFKCAICGKEYPFGKRWDGLPTGVKVTCPNGKSIKICAECILKLDKDPTIIAKAKAMTE